MDVAVIQEQNHLKIDSQSVVALVREFARFYNIRFDEASIHFVDKSKITQLHGEFFDDPTPTDCISFPIDDEKEEGYKVLGDIFVCPETASDYVAANGGDEYQEITLYVVHGLLHLIGYDDINEKDRAVMRSEESRCLAHITAKKLWLHS